MRAAQTQTKADGGSGDMFDSIAGRYDLLNRIMSLGMDRRWRRKTVDALCLGGGERVLDVATGTADLAIALARISNLEVVGLDPSPKMLAEGAAKIGAAGLSTRIRLVSGEAEALPFDDASFDAATIAFGIRNVPDRPRALRQMARVLKPGKPLAVLELSEPDAGLLAPLARLHIRRVVPRLGALLSGSRAYRYLQESVTAFPAPSDFASMMAANGFRDVQVTPLSFGACVLYVGFAS